MGANLKPLKKYGQHFLTNRFFADQIVSALKSDNRDVVVEIGAGLGSLTEIISQCAFDKCVVLEIDPRCVSQLKKKYGERVQVVETSVLKYDFKGLYHGTNKRLKIIGNIPYQLTSKIIFKVLENYEYISTCILMVQKEVADRLLAQPRSKNYGILTIMVALHAEVNRLLEIGKENFFPIPRIDSTVIELILRVKRAKIQDYDLFEKLINYTFNKRRKMLQNTLKTFVYKDILKKIKSVNLTVRPEELSPEDFIKLSNEISELTHQIRIN